MPVSKPVCDGVIENGICVAVVVGTRVSVGAVDNGAADGS